MPDLLRSHTIPYLFSTEYLEENQGVSTSQVLQAIQAGTEAFTGTATLSVTDYSVTVNT